MVVEEMETGCRRGRKERAGARKNACPRGSRGWAIAQRPARPGGRSGLSRDDGPEGRGQALPPVNELVDPDIHLLGHRRHAKAGRVEAGDVGDARCGNVITHANCDPSGRKG